MPPGLDGNVFALAPLSNGTLAVGGDFTTPPAAPALSRYLALWRDTCCHADWDSSGDVNSNDISAFLAAWIASVNAGDLAADFNLDDAVNSNDISSFLAAWLVAVQDGC